MVDILSGLNDKQREAVELDSRQSAFLLAGAGSGKTKTLTSRFAYLVSQYGVNPKDILTVTFTNKAANEMKARILLATGLPSLHGAFLGTFHSICNRILRENHKEANLSEHYNIVSTDEQKRLVKRVLKEFKVIDVTDDEVKHVIDFINYRKEYFIYETEDYVNFLWSRYKIEMLAYEKYQDLCAKLNVIDYNELMLRCYLLLRNHHHILRHYQNMFKYILVDEFQDTNRLQFDWLILLSGKHKNIFAVGDDDQSIYGFRGARPENIDLLKAHFDIKIIKLEQNYRSTKNILNAANVLIAKNENRQGKNLWTARQDTNAIQIVEGGTEHDVAKFVINKIRSMMATGEAKKYSDFAIVYRTNFLSRVIENELFVSNLPYHVYGGFRFYDRMEIKNFISYLKVIDNTKNDLALQRILNFPNRGVGEVGFNEIIEYSEVNNVSIWDMLEYDVLKRLKVLPKGINNLLKLKEDILTVRKKIINENLDFEAIFNLVNETFGIQEFYEKKETLMTQVDSNKVENIEALKTAMLEYDLQTMGEATISDFIQYTETAANDDNEADLIQLMSIHSSKGLEFENVFIIGTCDGFVPHKKSCYGDLLEEERRMMYVAITRAKTNLYICYHQFTDDYRKFKPSRFIDEINKEDYIKVSAI